MRVIAISAVLLAAALGAAALVAAAYAMEAHDRIAELDRQLLESRMNASLAAARAEAEMTAKGEAAQAGALTIELVKPDDSTHRGMPISNLQQQLRQQLQQQLQRMPNISAQSGLGNQANLADAATVKAQLNVDDHKAEATARIVTELRSGMAALFDHDPHHEADLAKVEQLRDATRTRLAQVLSPPELARAMRILDLPPLYRLKAMDEQPAETPSPGTEMH